MKYQKKALLFIANKIITDQPLTVDEYNQLISFHKPESESLGIVLLKQSALPLSILLGMVMTVFPDYFESLVSLFPQWTNLNPSLLAGIDYMWDLIGEPVKKTNLLYHLPNIVLYSFGIVGIKKIFDSIDKQTWMDKVEHAQSIIQERTRQGTVKYSLAKGHSILFVGQGDHIGKQFVLNHKEHQTITIAEHKPLYTNVWNYYDTIHSYEDLRNVLMRFSVNAGEYMFFPVRDNEVFLPSATAYDLSPYKLDILCQNIRKIEKECHYAPRRIIIIGDKYHQSKVQSEDKNKVIKNSYDVISLQSITKKNRQITLLDPTDIVLKKILSIANGRKIVFRATKDGIKEYKQRFYQRLELLGYKDTHKRKGVLTVGYDLFEEQTEQQTLSPVVDDYYPIVISKSVKDALLRNGYKEDEFLYVPDLVLSTLTQIASQQ